ncbi:MAG: hypothetical protein WCF90_00405 [Methanomicrobiales archaeon]
MFFEILSGVKDNYLLSATTMVSMDLNTAVRSYQFGEKAKSELIMVSQSCVALTGFSETERPGGRRMLLLLMDAIRNEIQFAFKSTGLNEFSKAINALSEAISLIESNQFDEALQKVAVAISASTTPAQEAWQVLSEHELL